MSIWRCQACTLENPSRKRRCGACNGRRSVEEIIIITRGDDDEVVEVLDDDDVITPKSASNSKSLRVYLRVGNKRQTKRLVAILTEDASTSTYPTTTTTIADPAVMATNQSHDNNTQEASSSSSSLDPAAPHPADNHATLKGEEDKQDNHEREEDDKFARTDHFSFGCCLSPSEALTSPFSSSVVVLHRPVISRPSSSSLAASSTSPTPQQPQQLEEVKSQESQQPPKQSSSMMMMFQYTPPSQSQDDLPATTTPHTVRPRVPRHGNEPPSHVHHEDDMMLFRYTPPSQEQEQQQQQQNHHPQSTTCPFPSLSPWATAAPTSMTLPAVVVPKPHSSLPKDTDTDRRRLLKTQPNDDLSKNTSRDDLQQQQQQLHITTEEEIEEEEESSSLVKPLSLPVIGFQTAGTKARMQVDDQQLQKAEQLLQTSTRDHVASVPAAAPVVGFHTAGSNSRIQVDDQQLQKAEQLLLQTSDVDQVASVPAAAPVVGFHTAGSNSRIQVDDQQLQKAEQLLLQTSDVDQVASVPAAAPVVGFHTAGSNSRIHVDDQQLQQAEQLLQTSDVDQVVNNGVPASESAAPIVGFHTAGSKSRIQVDDQQLQKAEKLLLQTTTMDHVVNQSVPASTSAALIVGFHTAGSKSRIQVNDQQLQQAEQLLKTSTRDQVVNHSTPASEYVAPIVGFHTAGSKSRIQVDAQQLQKAEQLLLQTTTMDHVVNQSLPASTSAAPIVGFHTAGSKSRIQVNDQQLQKAEQLLQTTTQDADSTSLDSAARIEFRKAGSKSVLQVDVKQLQQVTRLLESSKEDEENESSVPAAAGLSMGFQTAGSKSRIQIDDRQLEVAQLLLNGEKSDEFEPQEKSAALFNMATVQPSSFGLQTAGYNPRIDVDEASLQKAEASLQSVSSKHHAGITTIDSHRAGCKSKIQGVDQQLQNDGQSLKSAMGNSALARTLSTGPIVFMTAGSGSALKVDPEQLQEAEQLLQSNENMETGGDSASYNTEVPSPIGFVTAGSNSKISVDENELHRAEDFLKGVENDAEEAGSSSHAVGWLAFQTAGSKSKIHVDQRQLEKAEDLLHDTSTVVVEEHLIDTGTHIFHDRGFKAEGQKDETYPGREKVPFDDQESVPPVAGFRTAGSRSNIHVDSLQLKQAETFLKQESEKASRTLGEIKVATADIGFLSPESNLEVCVSKVGMKRTRSPSTDPDASPDAELQQLLEQGDPIRSKGAYLSAHTAPKAAFVVSPKSLLKRKSCEDGTRPNTKRRVSFQPSPDPYRSQLPQTPSFEGYGNHLSRRGMSFAGECEGARDARSQLCGGTLAAVTPAQKMQCIREGSITDSESKFQSMGKGDDDLECNTQNLESRFECKGETQSGIFEEKTVPGNFSHLRSIPAVTPARNSVGAREKDSIVRPMGETSGEIDRVSKEAPEFLDGPVPCATSIADISDANRLPKCTTLAEAFEIGAVHGDPEFWSNCGVNETTRHISSQNAGDVVFDTLSGLPCGFSSTAVEGTIGYLNDLRTELSERGCEPNKLQDAWLANHKRWIIWKLASYERSFCDFLGGKYLILDRLIEGLAKRYQIEIANGKRPAIRIILNRDAAASLPMILCVSRLFRGSDRGSQELPNKNSDASAKLRLTDGWYEIDAEIDSPLCSLVANEVIRVGTKLLVTNAVLRGAEQGVDPLDPEYQMTRPHLFLTTNSTRLAKWNSKLGFLRPPKGDVGTKFGVVKRISDVVAGGGDVPLLKMLVLRQFPKMYMEKRTAGNEILSEAEEDDRRNSFERRRMIAIEKLTDHVSKDVEKEIDEEAPEIWKKHTSDFGDSEVVHDQDRAALTAWMDKRRVLLQRRIQEEVEAELETDLSLLRKSIPFIRVLVHSAVIDKLKGRASERAILTIWDPTEDQINILKEGRVVEVQDIGTRSSAYDGCKQLTSSGRSSMRAIEDPAHLIDIYEASAFQPRQPFDMIRCHLSAHAMTTVGDQDTFDIAGVSISPIKPVRDDQKEFELYLTDGSQLLLRVYFEKVPFELSRAHGDFRTIAFNDLQMLPFDDVNNCAVARYSSMSSVSKASVTCLKRLESYKRESMSALNRVAAYVEARMPLRESCKAGTLIGTIVGMNLEDSRGEMLSINVDSFQSMEKLLLPTYFLETIREAVEINSASLADAEERRLEHMKTLGFLFRAHGVLWRFDFARISNGRSESLIVRHLEMADIERVIRLHASWM